MYIDKFEDGYSSRPVFDNISDVFNLITKESIKSILQEFALFLSINGDLIGYDTNDHKITLYLRTKFISKIQIFSFLKFFKNINQLIKKEGLTSITIDLDSLDMNFKINK